MDRKRRTQRLTLAAFFVAIEVIMTLTPVGYIPAGAINITTMHIPVILAGVLFGPGFGAGLGLLFGLTSLFKATFQPGITSFVFSPFITVGGIHGNFMSLVIVLGPRILLGWLSGKMFRVLHKVIPDEYVRAMVTAAVNTMIHTVLVMGGIWVFFAEPYAQALGLTMAGVAAAVIGVVTTNGIPEMILAGIVIPVLVRALKPSVVRMGLYEREEQHELSAHNGCREHAY